MDLWYQQKPKETPPRVRGRPAQSAEFALGTIATLEGSVILTSIAIGVPHGDKVTFSVNFQGTGVLEYED